MTDMPSHFYLPQSLITDQNGAPIPGAKVYFYDVGTTNQRTVYQDAARATPWTQPVVADSAGILPTVFLPFGDYKVNVTTSSGAAVSGYPRDNLHGPADLSLFLTGSSALALPVLSKTSSYSIVAGDKGKLIAANCTGGSFTLTLPSAVTVGDAFTIGVLHDGTANQVAIAAVSSQTIGGQQYRALTRRGECLWLSSDGANWKIASYAVPQEAHAPLPRFSVADRLSTPPVSPAGGARYIITGTPTGTWSARAAGDVAEADGSGGWIYRTPRDGWQGYVEDENLTTEYRDSAWVDLSNVTAPAATTQKRVVLSFEVASGTAGATPTINAWTQLAINTTRVNEITGATLSSNQITLPAGTYGVRAKQLFYQTNNSALRWRATDGSISVQGPAAFALFVDPTDAVAANNVLAAAHAEVEHKFTLASSKTFEVQYYVTRAGNLGVPMTISSTAEVYAEVIITDLATAQGPQGPQGLQGVPGLSDLPLTVGTAGSPGIITKASTRWLHDFTYGNNGTVTPSGGNTFLGIEAGNLTMGSGATLSSQASYNVGIGNNALKALTTGFNNIAIGESSLTAATTASESVGIGRLALFALTTGSSDIAIGNAAGVSLTTGSGNVLIGGVAGQYLTTASHNIAIGAEALSAVAAGDSNIAIGYQALKNNGGQYSLAIGRGALKSQSGATHGNVALGFEAGRDLTTGSACTVVGTEALQNNTTGGSNTAIGYQALRVNTTGIDHTAVGSEAMRSNVDGVGCTAVGRLSLRDNLNGSANTGVGDTSLLKNTTGYGSAAVGYSALSEATTGGYNAALGNAAGRSITTGDRNVFIGNEAGYNASQKVDATNSMALGNGAFTTASNQVVIGNTSVTDTVLRGAVSTGIAGSVLGSYSLAGNTSGVVTIKPQAAAGTYNFNLPTDAGTAGYALVSGGGGSAAMLWAKRRESLIADRTYYVRTDGNDSNTGLADTAGGAFLTIQKAIDAVAALDIGIYNVTIQVRDGTYSAGALVSAPWVGTGTVTLVGNTGTPANCILAGASTNIIRLLAGARLSIGGFKFTSSAHASHLYAESGSTLNVTGALDFGTAGLGRHVHAAYGATVRFQANCTISGGADVHWFGVQNGNVVSVSRTVTLTGTPNFTGSFAYCDRTALIECHACTFSGSATGKRYQVDGNGLIYTSGGGSTYLPGDSAGTSSTGGEYA